MKIILTVELKIPDNTAFSALTALHDLGFEEISGMIRRDYYEFESSDDKTFSDKIIKTDMLVNHNKHIPRINPHFTEGVLSVVEETEQDSSLLSVLRKLGLNVDSAKKGVLWQFFGIDKNTAEKAIKSLLVNRHYQSYRIL